MGYIEKYYLEMSYRYMYPQALGASLNPEACFTHRESNELNDSFVTGKRLDVTTSSIKVIISHKIGEFQQ